MSRQDHEKNKRMKETVDQLMHDPVCGNCGKPYREHKAFMENCPLSMKGEFSEYRYFVRMGKESPRGET